MMSMQAVLGNLEMAGHNAVGYGGNQTKAIKGGK
jgi:hypothetical protein